jgi:hypothetical protein
VKTRFGRWFASRATELQAQSDALLGRYDRAGRSGIELLSRAWADAPRNVPTPQVVIDDHEPVEALWGITFHECRPGRHEVEVWHRFAGRRGSIARGSVDVPDGGLGRVEYRAVWPAWRRGSLRQITEDDVRSWKTGPWSEGDASRRSR